MFVSIYYKPSLFNAHTMILIFHIFMNVNKLCLNQSLGGNVLNRIGLRERPANEPATGDTSVVKAFALCLHNYVWTRLLLNRHAQCTWNGLGALATGSTRHDFSFKGAVYCSQDSHSSGAVWESRWTSWAVRPNEPSGFRGRKELLNYASALVTACP